MADLVRHSAAREAEPPVGARGAVGGAAIIRSPHWVIVAVALLLIAAGCRNTGPTFKLPPPVAANSATTAAPVAMPPKITEYPGPTEWPFGKATKTSGCVMRQKDGVWLPDPECSPGAINPTLTKDVICSPEFRTDPYRLVPANIKTKVYDAYSVPTNIATPAPQPIPTAGPRGGKRWEIDHIVAIEDGGSNDIANLAPQPANPTPGFHQKDVVETWIRKNSTGICAGKANLPDVQKALAEDWYLLYQQERGKGMPQTLPSGTDDSEIDN